MEIGVQWRPTNHWGLMLKRCERVGWRDSLFIQVAGFCMWIYWHKREL